MRPVRRVLTEPLRITAVAAAAVWSAWVSTSRRKARQLAGSQEADKARQKAEARLRSIARTYDETTPLTLRLLVIEDHYLPGTPSWEWLSPSKPAFKVSCWMRVTAYHSSPLPPAETIGRILDVGEQPLSPIPLTRANTPPPSANEIVHAGHILTWDHPSQPVTEPERLTGVYRYVREPASPSVGEIRRQHGTVFALTLPPDYYYRMP